MASNESSVSPEDVKIVLFALNDVAPDTLDGGAYSKWKFTGLERSGEQWTLRYTHSGRPDGDFVRFTHPGPCVANGRIAKAWEDAAFEELRTENTSDDDFGADDF